MKKSFFLVLTLAIPVSIFLFLKFFGSNAFEVPVLFENGLKGCANSTTPHVVPEAYYLGEDMQNIDDLKSSFKVISVFDQADLETEDELIIQLVRIQDAFYEVGSPYFLLYPQDGVQDKERLTDLLVRSGMQAEHFSIISLDEEQMSGFLRCGVGLVSEGTTDLEQLVLVDEEGKIRGMYKSTDMEQTDRLILELKILKQKA